MAGSEFPPPRSSAQDVEAELRSKVQGSLVFLSLDGWTGPSRSVLAVKKKHFEKKRFFLFFFAFFFLKKNKKTPTGVRFLMWRRRRPKTVLGVLRAEGPALEIDFHIICPKMKILDTKKGQKW